jgi:phosphatidylglycerol lysyltransferase
VEDAINEMARRWMRSRNFKIKGYFIGLRLFDFEALKRYFYVEYEGHTVAGLACSPIYARNGYLLEDLMRDPDAPNGVSELMVLEAIRIFREEGRSMATFGISPRLALGGLGNLPRWSSLLLHPAATVANRVLGLNSLHHHREKFDTRHMEKCFLVKYPRRLRLMDLYGLLKTFNSTGTIFG